MSRIITYVSCSRPEISRICANLWSPLVEIIENYNICVRNLYVFIFSIKIHDYKVYTWSHLYYFYFLLLRGIGDGEHFPFTYLKLYIHLSQNNDTNSIIYMMLSKNSKTFWKMCFPCFLPFHNSHSLPFPHFHLDIIFSSSLFYRNCLNFSALSSLNAIYSFRKTDGYRERDFI